jgi:hypothetical protein
VKENLTERLADFVVATRLDDLADSARERARIVLVDTVASALMGSRSEEVPLIERLASAVAGPGRSPVVGRPPQANAGAVLVTGTSAAPISCSRSRWAWRSPPGWPWARTTRRSGRTDGIRRESGAPSAVRPRPARCSAWTPGT